MSALLTAGYNRVTLLAETTIGAAVTAVTTTPVTGLLGMHGATVQFKFLYGAGGTSVKAYLQTSIDGGVTWFDIAAFAATTAALTRLFSVRSGIAVAPNITPGSGVLADNTILDGVLGDRLRILYTSVGVYTGATSLAVHAVTKGY